jgi:hypothetical protein
LLGIDFSPPLCVLRASHNNRSDCEASSLVPLRASDSHPRF